MARPVSTHKLWLVLSSLCIVASSLLTTLLIQNRHDRLRNDHISHKSGVYRFVVSKAGNRIVLQEKGFFFSTDQWPAEIRVHPGDEVVIKGTFRNPRSPKNPFDFNEQSFARSNGWIGYITSVRDVIVDHSTHRLNVRYARHRIQSGIKTRINERYATHQSRGIVAALLLGDRSQLKEETVDAFKRAGLGHLLAISGLHMGIMASLAHVGVWILLRRIPIQMSKKRRVSALFSISFVSLFAVIVAPSPSVIRSAVMICLVLVAGINQKKWLPFRVLGIAFVFILVFRPTDIVAVGFWLSFAAVAAILIAIRVVGKRKKKTKERLIDHIRTALIVTVAAISGTSPILMYSFGYFPWITIVVSPIAVFLLSIALPIAFLSVLLPTGIQHFVTISDTLLQTIQLLAERSVMVAWIPVWTTPIHSIPWWLGPFWSAIVLILFKTNRRIRAWTLTMWMCWAVTTAFKQQQNAEITFFDVGQGDALLFQTYDGEALVVDTGPRPSSGTVILNHLQASAVLKHTQIVLSHGHLDHIAGTTSLITGMYALKRYPRSIYHGGWLKKGRFDGTNSIQLKRGDQINLGPSVRVYVLHPAQPGYTNNDSVVLLIKYGPTGILLMGDAEAKAEQQVTDSFYPLLKSTSTSNVTLLKVGHHGSKTSSTTTFVEMIRPTISLISVGMYNSFNHPNESIIQRLKTSGSVVLLTSENNAAQFLIDQNGLTTKDWKK